MIVRVIVVLKRAVIGDSGCRRFNNLCGSHHRSQVNGESSVDGIPFLVVNLIGQYIIIHSTL